MAEYKALYRKYRPMTFDDVQGQGHISNTLKNSVKSGCIAHAYLFCGTRGTGKTTTAKILSRAVNCENPNEGNPCNECPSCLGILNGSILDVYEMDAASNSGVNNIREIRDEVIYSPADCKYKVYIIDEAHMLSTEAFNALLKTLEEPPGHVIFILATTEPESIIPTILSRCQRFDFKRISANEISSRINKISEKENILITPDASELIAELADGSMRDALSILEQCSSTCPEGLKVKDVVSVTGIIDKSVLFNVTEAIISQNAYDAIKHTAEILNIGKEVSTFFEDLISHFRNLMLCTTSENPSGLLEMSTENIEKYQNQAKRLSLDNIIYCIKVLGEHLSLSKKLPTPRVATEMAIIKMCTPSYSEDLESILSRLSSLENKLNSSSLTYTAGEQKKETTENYQKKEESLPLPTLPRTEDGVKWNKWPEAVKKIKEESKTLYTFLFNAEALNFGSEIEIVLSSDLAYTKIATTEGKKYLSSLFSNIQGNTLDVVVSKKGSLKERQGSSPSIFDIAAKKDLLGDKMTIIDGKDQK